MEPIRITSPGTDNQLLYFTSPSLTSGDDVLVFLREDGGNPNIYCKKLPDGPEVALTDNRDGSMKSYVYFWGGQGKGLGKASISLHPDSGTVYYIQGNDICSVDIRGNRRVLASLPKNQVTAFTHVSADGTRLCVPTTDCRALEYDTPQDMGKNAPDYDTDRRIQEENLSSTLRVYDTASGREILSERVERAWVTHVQFCPTDNDVILYNHEWPSDCGIRRMWLYDGKNHIRLRTEGNGRSKHDWTCHEMWTPDGQGILYHGTYQGGRAYVGKVNRDGSGLIEIPLPDGFTKYGHFTMSGTGRLVSDGYYQESQEPGPAQWISLIDADWHAGTMEWTPLCRSGSSWASQDSHPHPVFSHRGDAVYFTSDREGFRAVYRIPV